MLTARRTTLLLHTHKYNRKTYNRNRKMNAPQALVAFRINSGCDNNLRHVIICSHLRVVEIISDKLFGLVDTNRGTTLKIEYI
jgi:hypothetical protein